MLLEIYKTSIHYLYYSIHHLYIFAYISIKETYKIYKNITKMYTFKYKNSHKHLFDMFINFTR